MQKVEGFPLSLGESLAKIGNELDLEGSSLPAELPGGGLGEWGLAPALQGDLGKRGWILPEPLELRQRFGADGKTGTEPGFPGKRREKAELGRGRFVVGFDTGFLCPSQRNSKGKETLCQRKCCKKRELCGRRKLLELAQREWVGKVEKRHQDEADHSQLSFRGEDNGNCILIPLGFIPVPKHSSRAPESREIQDPLEQREGMKALPSPPASRWSFVSSERRKHGKKNRVRSFL